MRSGKERPVDDGLWTQTLWSLGVVTVVVLMLGRWFLLAA